MDKYTEQALKFLQGIAREPRGQRPDVPAENWHWDSDDMMAW